MNQVNRYKRSLFIHREASSISSTRKDIKNRLSAFKTGFEKATTAEVDYLSALNDLMKLHIMVLDAKTIELNKETGG